MALPGCLLVAYCVSRALLSGEEDDDDLPDPDLPSDGTVSLEEHCHTVGEGDPCFGVLVWAKMHGIFKYPDRYPGLTDESSLGEFQESVHKSMPAKCPKPCLGGNPDAGPCAPPLQADRYGACNPVKEPVVMTFYMYRAQGKEDYPVANVNLASLAGVMWYLHHEVVGSRPRKFSIERIIRYRVTMKSTRDWYNRTHRHFGPFIAFDTGMAEEYEPTWRQYGYVVGCQLVLSDDLQYVAPPEEHPGCHPEHAPICKRGKWYSLPGPCPGVQVGEKSRECILDEPGGECPSSVVTGEQHCTYWAQFAGQVSLDELVGIGDYDTWWLRNNSKGHIVPNKNIEYNPFIDKGIGTSFWDNAGDEAACTKRMQAVRRLLKEKFPDYPEMLPEPPCV